MTGRNRTAVRRLLQAVPVLALFFALTACETHPDEVPDPDTSAGVGQVVSLSEAYLTERDTLANVDSPAIWHGPDGQHWLLATAKEGDAILAYDGATGRYLHTIGAAGADLGSFARPNGIGVIDDLLLVVERDNQRIQVFRLPDGQPLGIIGEGLLRRPYGMTLFQTGDGSYRLYVTDNYETPDEEIPPDSTLGERVHAFTFRVAGGTLQAEHLRAFGETSGPGVLRKVESLHADPLYGRLLVADEAEDQINIKIYTLEGQFTGEVLGQDLFQFEPEGIALYACEDSTGYWIVTDQDDFNNAFHVFERESLAHVGAFGGEVTANTDGVALTQRSLGNFPSGVFFAVHDDGNVAAFSWADIAEALDLRTDCTAPGVQQTDL